MLFNSHEFLFVFLPVVFMGFVVLARRAPWASPIWLALGSVFFYGWLSREMTVLLLASILFNYVGGRVVDHARCNGAYLRGKVGVIVVANLALLGYFKYANFFVDTINKLGGSIDLISIALPMGISFFTFTQIAYVVDVSKGNRGERSFVNYLLFVTWFPHLVAGPVLHHKQMMPQFHEMASGKSRFSAETVSVGLSMFSMGLFKKVVLADNIAVFANPAFDAAAAGQAPMMVEAWVALLAYSLQLYFDFSGYSDMAIGLSRMFGVRLPLNFDSPYKATSIVDFWRRWHMTLSSFLRDYLYIPLGGNRNGEPRRYLNLFLTMVLGGLWHGASWNFVIWGGLHGLYLVINNFWSRIFAPRFNFAGIISRGLFASVTFFAVVLAWVPFRSADFSTAMSMWSGLFGLNGVALPTRLEPWVPEVLKSSVRFQQMYIGDGLSFSEAVLSVFCGLICVWFFPNSQQWLAAYRPAWESVQARIAWWSWRPTRGYAVAMGVLLAASILAFKKNSPFLYFQF